MNDLPPKEDHSYFLTVESRTTKLNYCFFALSSNIYFIEINIEQHVTIKN